MSLSTIIEQSFGETKSLSQRQDFHPEKWVFTHLSYCAYSLRQMTEDGSREQREMMLVAAFHDIGKIPTTKRKNGDGYIVSYGHAKKSVYYWDAVADILCDENDLRSDVIRWLIKEHMNIKFLDRMNESTIKQKKKEADKLGDLVWKMGIAFAEADDMLSFFDRHDLDYIEPVDPAEEVPVIDLHEEAIGRFKNYIRNLIEKIEEFEEEDDDKNLIIVRGVPGSGKTSLAKMIAPTDLHLLASDDYFYENGEYKFDKSKLGEAHNWCKNQVESFMNVEMDPIILHNTGVHVWEMLRYYYLAAKYGYRVHSIIKENRHGGKSEHDVPESTCERMSDNFEINLY